jgi:hypothetical protein
VQAKVIELNMPPTFPALVDKSNFNRFPNPIFGLDHDTMHRVSIASMFGVKHLL